MRLRLFKSTNEAHISKYYQIEPLFVGFVFDKWQRNVCYDCRAEGTHLLTHFVVNVPALLATRVGALQLPREANKVEIVQCFWRENLFFDVCLRPNYNATLLE